ncbi:hypothetical protein [Psychrobacillus sp. L3]|uniref:hypothetical protein n=1 Tax=Psychrobacillus sp. L3 TaxID=3236891 RepID=UPI0036F32142
MVKRYLVLLGFLLIVLTLTQVVVKSETNSEVEGFYVTTEDIILDIILPIIDERVMKEYGQNTLSWHWNRIVGITYNDNHSYDVTVKIEIATKNLDESKEDIVKVRISPSCDSNSINKQICNHDFKIEILDYKHSSP